MHINWTKLLARHEKMVLDPLRTGPLARAIKDTVKRGDVVLDIGCGLGLLSVLALRVGAKKVYAIEVDKESLLAAKFFAKKFGYKDQIKFIQGLSFDIKLPEKVDIIICETVGSFGFDENIAYTLSDAKKRFLKKGGKIIPEKIELFGALITEKAAEYPWADVLGMNFSPPVEDLYHKIISPKDIMSEIVSLRAPRGRGNLIVERDCFVAKAPRNDVHMKANFTITRDCTLGGLAVWPKVCWSKNFMTDSSPFERPTHWEQGILPTCPVNAKRGDKFSAEIMITPHPEFPKTQTEVSWKVK